MTSARSMTISVQYHAAFAMYLMVKLKSSDVNVGMTSLFISPSSGVLSVPIIINFDVIVEPGEVYRLIIYLSPDRRRGTAVSGVEYRDIMGVGENTNAPSMPVRLEATSTTATPSTVTSTGTIGAVRTNVVTHAVASVPVSSSSFRITSSTHTTTAITSAPQDREEQVASKNTEFKVVLAYGGMVLLVLNVLVCCVVFIYNMLKTSHQSQTKESYNEFENTYQREEPAHRYRRKDRQVDVGKCLLPGNGGVRQTVLRHDRIFNGKFRTTSQAVRTRSALDSPQLSYDTEILRAPDTRVPMSATSEALYCTAGIL